MRDPDGSPMPPAPRPWEGVPCVPPQVACAGASAITDAHVVVLCDIGLPGMDGYEFARQFRARAGKRRVRLVAVSGYAHPEDVARAAEAGFDAHREAMRPGADRAAPHLMAARNPGRT
jgi:hypothetical protein